MESIFLFILSYPCFHFLGKWDNWIFEGLDFLYLFVVFYTYIDLSRSKRAFDVETKDVPLLPVSNAIFTQDCRSILAFLPYDRMKAHTNHTLGGMQYYQMSELLSVYETSQLSLG